MMAIEGKRADAGQGSSAMLVGSAYRGHRPTPRWSTLCSMLPRIWTCVEPAWPLRLLGLPLYPVAILLTLAAALLLYGLGRRGASRRAWRLAAVQCIALTGLLGLFGFLGVALAMSEVNPTMVLRFVPWVCALVGPVATAVGLSRRGSASVATSTLTDVARPPVLGRAVALLAMIGVLAVVAMVALRSFLIDNCWPYASAPYRFVELVVTDQVDAIATDECLASRALEYGPMDLSVKRPARQLRERGVTAVPGVVAVVEQARSHWPPAPHTVSHDGMRWALDFLEEKGEAAAVARWQGVEWGRDITRANACWRLGSPEGSWVSP